MCQTRADRSLVNNIFGALFGALAQIVPDRADPPEEMKAKFSVILRRGDVIRHEQAGGGGFGPRAERAAHAIAADARNEKVTR